MNPLDNEWFEENLKQYFVAEWNFIKTKNFNLSNTEKNDIKSRLLYETKINKLQEAAESIPTKNKTFRIFFSEVRNKVKMNIAEMSKLLNVDEIVIKNIENGLSKVYKLKISIIPRFLSVLKLTILKYREIILNDFKLDKMDKADVWGAARSDSKLSEHDRMKKTAQSLDAVLLDILNDQGTPTQGEKYDEIDEHIKNLQDYLQKEKL